MTQPYPPQFGAPAPGPAPQQYQQPQAYAPQQGYPPAQASYPAAAPPQQGYGQQPPAYGYPPQQGAYPMQQPQYAQPPQQYQAPAPQLPAQPASLDAFYSMPSSGWGPAWQLGLKAQDGTSYIGVVAQWITKAHFEYAEDTDPQTGQRKVRTFKNGDAVVNMKIPLNVAVDGRFTEGRAQFYVGPGEKDLLNAAIAAGGGDPTQPPPIGSMIRATKTGTRGNVHGGQSAVKSVEWWPPQVAQQYAAQAGIPFPDLNTPRPAVEEAKHAAPEAPAAAPAPSAGPAVQQQAAVPPPVAQPQPPVGPPAGLPPAPQAQVPSAPVGPPQGMPQAPAPQMAQPPAGPPPAPGLPPAPGVGAMPADPAAQQLLMHLTGRGPAPAAPAA